MCHLGVVLYEYLGEEYPEVLGSILGGLKVGGSKVWWVEVCTAVVCVVPAVQAVVNVVGMTRMQPPIKDLLPRLTPILKNRRVHTPSAWLQQHCLCSTSVWHVLSSTQDLM